jgi:hypothetical protein
MRTFNLVLFAAMILTSMNSEAANCKKQFAECTASAAANVKICKQQRKECWQSKKAGLVTTPPTDAATTPPAVK